MQTEVNQPVIPEVKTDRLFVFVHGDENEQSEFIKECGEHGCYAHPIKFMVRQRPLSFYPRSKDNMPLDTKIFINGERPYMSISNANPDKIGSYCNWTYLESAIQHGWKRFFLK